jgi:N-methylhydantoinase A/oxoprolinase/acetone carboxylase beta subunit
MARYRIGTDIGGTFTDLCVLRKMRRILQSQGSHHAQGSHPGSDRSAGDFLPERQTPEDTTLLFHATTVAPTLCWSKKAGDTGWRITEGF